jgi:hypothetical protein
MVVAPLVALWRGNVPLSQAFWEYAIAYGTIANIVATAPAVAAVAAGLPDAMAIGLFLAPIPYILTAVVGVVRGADRYQGPPMWAGLAKVAVIVWGAAMIVI